MPSTKAEDQWHTLDFFTDNNSCALTIFVNGVRFHITANGDELDKTTSAGSEYHDLLHDLRRTPSEDVQTQRSSNSGGGHSDSGVELHESKKKGGRGAQKEHPPSYDVERTLKTWMVTPLVDSFEDLAPARKGSPQTLQEWYYCPTRFCKLVVSDTGDEIEAVELESTPDLQKKIEKLIPQTFTPKYISNKLNAPIYNASDLHVLEASDQPVGTPYHPCKVQHTKDEKTYFLKIVDNSDPRSIKREIDILRRIKASNLQDQILVPSLEGLVRFDDAKSTPSGRKRFMGFLQTVIPDPTPLNFMLRKEVSKKKREGWAKEVERVKDVLHEYNIVWGDAKADNFVVDGEGRLWIIDFGGGYTEGWVEEKVSETMEGDEIGIGKIVGALRDPVKNVRAAQDATAEGRSGGGSGGRRGKRKERDDDDEAVEGKSRNSKSRKRG